MATVSGYTTVTATVVQFIGPNATVGGEDGTVGFFGSAGDTVQTVAADASDLGTAVTLVNSIKDALLAYGLVAE